jgi:hypothetical protein
MIIQENCTYSGDVCVLTNVFVNFLSDATLFPPTAECDAIEDFSNDPERKLFCQAIKQTVLDFQAPPLSINWSDPNYNFPDVCNGRSATVCAICRAVQAEFVRTASTGTPNYEVLTNNVLSTVITEQPECSNSLRGRLFGQHSCNYAIQINSDFTCATWTALLASPACTGLAPEACFQRLLTSNLIEGAAARLYKSSYCEKEMGTYAARILAEVLV